MLEVRERRRRRLCTLTCTLVIIGPLVLCIILFFLLGLFTSGLASQHAIDLPSPSPLPEPETETEPSSPPAEIALTTADKQSAIVNTFRFAWDGYYKIAFPHDELKPTSNEPGYSRNDWGATAVDALGTAILMEQAEVVNIVMDHIQNIDFSRTDGSISVFETTIRYMGGMLSAYDLLTGPFVHLVTNLTQVQGLLVQSDRLGGILSKAFIDGEALPHSRLQPNAEGVEDDTNSVAGAGTLVLEWSRLSDLVQKPQFEDLSRAAEAYLLDPKPKEAEPLPGLVGTTIDVATGLFKDRAGGWGGSGDSFYEYLIKMYLYDPEKFGHYKDRWVLAANSTMTYLGSSPEGLPDIIWLGKFDGERYLPESGHMECFAGGNFLLAGQILQEQKYTDFGLKLIDGCHYQYESTATKIGPEAFRWNPSECKDRAKFRWLCDWQPGTDYDVAMNEEKKFWIVEPSYNLRPETIESYYYAYRMTKDKKYQDWAWDAFVAINATTRMEYGFNYYRDVRTVDGPMGNNQESYFFSETLKYLWLIFDEREDGGEWHVNAGFKGEDKWVYNTEGHPLRIR